jgi:hypothetical protein
MDGPGKPDRGRSVRSPGLPREFLGNPGAVAAARQRTMSERLELALSWNAIAAELRAGLTAVTGSTSDQR